MKAANKLERRDNYAQKSFLRADSQSRYENVGQASSLPVHGASSPRGSGGRMSPELADKMSALHFQTGSQRFRAAAVERN